MDKIKVFYALLFLAIVSLLLMINFLTIFTRLKKLAINMEEPSIKDKAHDANVKDVREKPYNQQAPGTHMGLKQKESIRNVLPETENLDMEVPKLKHNIEDDREKRHNQPPPGTQMGQKQIESILKVLPETGNLLVWGLGYDSPFWHQSTRGRVIFIEPAGIWYDNVTAAHPYLEVHKVKYTTNLVDSFNKYLNHTELWTDLDLRSQLPSAVVSELHWHVIIVDAPQGFGDGPGRYQSIYTSSRLARKGSHIFVDDFERRVEHEYSLKMLGQPIEIKERPGIKGVVNSNLQAHFLL